MLLKDYHDVPILIGAELCFYRIQLTVVQSLRYEQLEPQDHASNFPHYNSSPNIINALCICPVQSIDAD